jgi:hypothetical protein
MEFIEARREASKAEVAEIPPRPDSDEPRRRSTAL